MATRSLGDAAEAEDVAQESLARLIDALRAGRLDDPSRPGAFARGIARHLIADIRRRAPRSRSVDPAVLDASRGDGPDPLAALVAREARLRVRAALNELNESDRELLRLTFLEGWTPAELAASSAEPASRIRKRKSRALERLRQALLDTGHDLGARATDVDGGGSVLAWVREER